jgi:hypothetical protein
LQVAAFDWPASYTGKRDYAALTQIQRRRYRESWVITRRRVERATAPVPLDRRVALPRQFSRPRARRSTSLRGPPAADEGADSDSDPPNAATLPGGLAA